MASSLHNGLLAAYLPRLDAVPLVATDQIGSEHGSMLNGATLGLSDGEAAYLLDGVNDYIEFGQLFSGIDSFSVSFWANPVVFGSTRAVVGGWAQNVADQKVLIDITSSGELRFFTRNASGVQVGGVLGASVGLNAWNHVICEYGGTTMRGYVNGQKAATEYSQTGQLRITSFPWGLGRDGRNQNYFSGYIDGVAVWSRPLTNRERTHLATSRDSVFTAMGSSKKRRITSYFYQQSCS